MTPVLSSTALLTLLLSIGLFFFIRASTKDRTEVTQLLSEQGDSDLTEQLEKYFVGRAYKIAAVDTILRQIMFVGVLRPSLFLAIFLTALAAVGTLCIALVLSLLFPNEADFFPGLVVIAPVAGIFYWKKAGRQERVLLKIETILTEQGATQQLLTVTAHRDELAELQRSLNLKPVNP
jgi:hypothetical protein